MGELSTETGLTIIGFGAGSLDLYLPKINDPNQLPEDYVAGGKVGWRDEDEAVLLDLMEDPSVERHVGGNWLNVATYLASLGIHEEVGFAGVLGTDDIASEAIHHELHRFGIADYTKRDPEYRPSIGIIVRGPDDRMVRGRPRDAMRPYWSNEDLTWAFGSADVAVASSVKDTTLTQRWLDCLPGRAFVSLNPGGIEFDNDPFGLSTAMQERNVDLLALNDDELRKLIAAYDSSQADNKIEDLALLASNLYARHVLCTLGKTGLLIASNGQVQKFKPKPVKIVADTLGAGDRAHSAALNELAQGHDPQKAGQAAVIGAAKVIQKVGAHGDLRPKRAS